MMPTVSGNNPGNQKAIEKEIAELQRKFRTLENDKRSSSEDDQGKIRKQRATIEKLTRENRKMKAELNETRSAPGSQAENRIAMKTIKNITDQKDTLDKQLKTEETLKETLTEQLRTVQSEIGRAREDLGRHGGVTASLDNSKAVQKQIRVLENRLDQALKKFNEAIAANRSLREQIDTLRRERVVFNDIYKKLEDELNLKKQEMARIIDQANAAYEARDSAQQQMAALKNQADKEHAEFEKEWKELGRLIENDKKMKEFIKQRVKGASDTIKPGAKDATDRHAVTAKPAETPMDMNIKALDQEKIAAHEESFMKIQAATGIDNIDKLVQTFQEYEDTNFSLFKYNNELSADIEKLEQQIAECKEEYITLSGKSERKEDTEKVKIIETLEEKLQDIDKKSHLYESKYQESVQTLNNFRSIIYPIYRKLASENPPGCSTGISESNMLTFLAVIEQRTNELLKIYNAIYPEDDEAELARQTRPPPSTNIQKKLPSTVEEFSEPEDDDDDEDQWPKTRDELKAITIKSIRHKSKKGKTKVEKG